MPVQVWYVWNRKRWESASLLSAVRGVSPTDNWQPSRPNLKMAKCTTIDKKIEIWQLTSLASRGFTECLFFRQRPVESFVSAKEIWHHLVKRCADSISLKNKQSIVNSKYSSAMKGIKINAMDFFPCSTEHTNSSNVHSETNCTKWNSHWPAPHKLEWWTIPRPQNLLSWAFFEIIWQRQHTRRVSKQLN